MDFFKEYGTTKKEIIIALQDAIYIIDRYTKSNPDPFSGTADRVFEAMQILKREWGFDED